MQEMLQVVKKSGDTILKIQKLKKFSVPGTNCEHKIPT